MVAVAIAVALVSSACLLTPVPHPADQVCPAGAARWSDAATWGGSVPAAGAHVTVPANRTVALDVSPPALGSLQVDGRLVACRRDLELSAGWIVVHGLLQAGTAEVPFTHRFAITLTDADQARSVMEMGTRGILVMDGQLELHGDPPSVAWTKVGAHVPAGSSTLTLSRTVDWAVGDRIAITLTDWYGTGSTEVRTITALGTSGGRTVATVDSPISRARWGVLQHVTSTGMGLAPDPSVTPTASPTPTVLDERAEVANLTRNIVIQGPDDAAWRQQRFGAHVMAMGTGSRVQLEGVEMRRMGQRGRLGRYPIHWHRMSYGADGSTLADVSGHWIRSSTIHQSANRCITIHATNGVQVHDNVCVDITGHGVFLEDGVERRNQIVGNLVAGVRNPPAQHALKVHEITYDQGSSGMWISNPDNTITGNNVSDAQGVGYWLAFARRPFGLSSNVPMRPDRTRFGVFDDNTAHSNGHHGMMFDFVEQDEAGNVAPHQYFSTTDGVDPVWPMSNLRRFTINRFTTWKNQHGGFWNRVTWPNYREFVSADNEDRFFAGAGADGVIERSLVVGTSLNSATPRPHPEQVPTAFASYHSSFDMRDNLVVNFPVVPGARSGTFATDDYYIRPVDKGHARNPGNVRINADAGYRVPRPSPSYALSGALWDPHGTWGPAGRYLVYDDPFLTQGTTCSAVVPASTGAASCTGPYYGIVEPVLNRANERWDARLPMAFTRYSAAGSPVGTWSIADGNLISAFSNMRHAAVHGTGRYLLDFPGAAPPGDVGFTVENAATSADTFVIGVRFDGDDPAGVFASSYYHYLDAGYESSPPSASKRDYTAVASLAAVQASAGQTYWQDTANDVVWIKVAGGVAAPLPAGTPPFSDDALYRAFHLRVH